MKILLSAILIILLNACETSKERTAPPMGYVKHCMDYPDSIFCKKK